MRQPGMEEFWPSEQGSVSLTRTPEGRWTMDDARGRAVDILKQVEQAEALVKAAQEAEITRDAKGNVKISKSLAKALKANPDFNLTSFMQSNLYKQLERVLPKQDWHHLEGEGYEVDNLKLIPVLKNARQLVKDAEQTWAKAREGAGPEAEAAKKARDKAAEDFLKELDRLDNPDLLDRYTEFTETAEAGRVPYKPYDGWWELSPRARDLAESWERAQQRYEKTQQFGGTTTTRSKGFDRFIEGKTVNTYRKLFRELGYKADVEALKELRPDVQILEEPQNPGDPIRVAVPEGTAHRFGWLWPNIPSADALPIPGKGFYASRGGIRQNDPLMDSLSKDWQGRWASLPSKEGRLWNPKQVSDLSKIDHPLWEAVNAPRALITSLDLSGILRQGFPATARQLMTNPQLVGRAIKDSIISMRDPAYYDRAMAEIE